MRLFNTKMNSIHEFRSLNEILDNQNIWSQSIQF
jgi:hypothetical protein